MVYDGSPLPFARILFVTVVRMGGFGSVATEVSQQSCTQCHFGWDFNGPDMPLSRDGTEDKTVDLVMLSGLRSRVGAAAWGRPISQRAVGNPAAALDNSPLARFLGSLTCQNTAGPGRPRHGPL